MGKVRPSWFWGFSGLIGLIGAPLHEPRYYLFFVLFLFFLEPLIHDGDQP